MLKSLHHLTHSSVNATDGEIGKVNAAFFDDQRWTIRYLVVDTGAWLVQREVLISPYSVKKPLAASHQIAVDLTRAKVEASPNVDTHQPVSRQHEMQMQTYYGLPDYWDGVGLWGMNAYPLVLPGLVTDRAPLGELVPKADAHLRSSAKVTGYEIHATDESIGHVQDFVFDDESWTIRYLVIDTRNWWPGGKKVLIATHWIESIDWATSTVHVKLTRDQVKNSPQYHEELPIARDYEERLHASYRRPGYWDY